MKRFGSKDLFKACDEQTTISTNVALSIFRNPTKKNSRYILIVSRMNFCRLAASARFTYIQAAYNVHKTLRQLMINAFIQFFTLFSMDICDNIDKYQSALA